ncbi:class I SAM-dependent methyltransferase, partial [Streptomyces beihaiensis]|uniref:class I SAM-dependent methyltransferase n=1 Tax=Streptomyces beihaiensis TaxID=2984495 RepID=UPI00389AE25A
RCPTWPAAPAASRADSPTSGPRPVGVDLADGRLRAAGSRPGGAVARGDACRLPFADGTFDVVTAVWPLRLRDDAEPVVVEARRCRSGRRPSVRGCPADRAGAAGSSTPVCGVVAGCRLPRRRTALRPAPEELGGTECTRLRSAAPIGTVGRVRPGRPDRP